MKRTILSATRRSKKMLQREAAKEIGIAWKYLSAIERGIKTPSLEVAIRIAELYEVEVYEFKNLFKKERMNNGT